jgi:sugar phosphate permease
MPRVSALSRIDAMLRPQGRVFFGWWITLAAAGLNLLPSALLMQSFGAYVVLLQAEFGWSKTLLAGAFSMMRAESGLLGPLQGWAVDRFGPQNVLRSGLLLFGLGFMALSRIETIVEFYLAFMVIAVGSSLSGFVTLMASLVSWFDRHRSKAVAYSQMGFAVGGLCVPAVVIALETFGWRTTALASGFAILGLGLPLTAVVRHRPEQYGESVDGLPETGVAGRAGVPGGNSGIDRSGDMTASEALRTRAFWCIAFGHASALLVVSAVMVHLVPHLTEGLGYSLATAGAVVAALTFVQMIGQLAGGWLGDRINKRIITVVCMVAHAFGLLVLAKADSGLMVAAFIGLHGLAWGVRGPLMVAMRADYFGASSFGTIMGFSSMIVMLGMIAGPLVAGILRDRTESYQMGFTILALLAGLGSIFFWLATPPPQPRRPNSEATTPATRGEPTAAPTSGASG